MNKPKHNRALIAETDFALGGIYEVYLEYLGYDTLISRSIETIRVDLLTFKPNVLLMDYQVLDGYIDEVVGIANQTKPKPWIILTTGWTGHFMWDVSDVQYILPKPFHLDNFEQLFRKLKKYPRT